MTRFNMTSGKELRSVALLLDLALLIREIERGDQIAWDGDDFVQLLCALQRAYEFIAACKGLERHPGNTKADKKQQ